MTEIKQSASSELSRADFERALQAELEKSPNAWSWNWLNLPFTLWALSAVGVSLLSFWFNGYSSCTTDQRADNLTFSKLFLEMYQRRDRISLFANMDNSLDALNSAITAIDPDTTYVFAEYKGKKLAELTVNLNSIVYKWGVLSKEVTTTQASAGTGTSDVPSVVPSSPPDFDLGADYWTQVYQQFATTSGNVSSALLIDAQAASKNPLPSKLNEVIARIQSVAKTLTNRPELAIFLSQQNMIKPWCVLRGFWRD
jgi:hypothetical protein